MDTLIGIVGSGFVLLAADVAERLSVVQLKADADKIVVLDKNKMLGAVGPVGDRIQFVEFVAKNLALSEFRTYFPATTLAAANYTRNELATSLRKHPYQVDLLLAGFDEGIGPSLYYIDYIAAMHKVDFAAHGHGSNFVLSILDRFWKPDMTVDEGVDLLKKCLCELQTRFIVNTPDFKVKLVDAEGIRIIPL